MHIHENLRHMICNNNNITAPQGESAGGFFNLERGVRQECPLLAHLFILAKEILSNKIRHEKDIKGIKIDIEEISRWPNTNITRFKINRKCT